MKHLNLFIFLILSSNSIILAQSDLNNQKDKNGNKQGFWIEENGLKECYYSNNKYDGVFKYYHKNRVLYCIGEFKEGREIGTWYFFDDKGRLTSKLVNITENNQEILLDDQVTKKKPLFKAYLLNYYSNGKVESEGIVLFDDDFEENYYEFGLWKYYNEKGLIIKTENK